jgi:hypothetical protein
MDNATSDNIDRLLEIGGRAAQQVDKAHFGGFAP